MELRTRCPWSGPQRRGISCRFASRNLSVAGHYHRPLLGAGVWPAGWEVLELGPARVAEQQRVLGRRRVSDAIDLEAMTELVLPATGAGHGSVCRGRRAHRMGDASQPTGATAGAA